MMRRKFKAIESHAICVRLCMCECEKAVHNSITYVFNICTKYMTTLISRILFHKIEVAKSRPAPISEETNKNWQ